MSPTSRFRHLRNPLTLFGIWLTTVSAILFLVVFFADLLGLPTNPYIGIVFFLILPGLFVFGLVHDLYLLSAATPSVAPMPRVHHGRAFA